MIIVKLAEGLVLRADIRKRIEQLRERLKLSALVPHPTHPLSLALLTLTLLLPCSRAVAQANKPSVLFTGNYSGRCGYEAALKLTGAGFVLDARQGNIPSLEDLRKFNVLVVTGLGMANADGTLPDSVTQNIATLNRYLDSGGGVLVLPAYCQQIGLVPPQVEFLKPLGLTPLFDELISDPENSAVGTAWKIRFARTTSITDGPLTANVKALWYPTPPDRIGGGSHSVACAVDPSWTVAVSGSPSSSTTLQPINNERSKGQGHFQQSVPLAAYRSVGKGRIVYLGISGDYLVGSVPTTTLEGIVLDRGLKGTPSDGFTLLSNCLSWLAAPSLAAGDRGGAAQNQEMLRNPHKIKFSKPFTWDNTVSFPAQNPRYTGVVGARTRYSSGTATADEWVRQARAKGLSFIVFLEEFSKLSSDDFTRLKADCTRLSTPDCAAIPGFTIEDEIGNHYFYCGTTFAYPERKFLSPNGKVFRSYEPSLPPGDPKARGQLAMTTLDYGYSGQNFALTAGNYLFHQGAAPFADWFSDWDVMGVVTTRNGAMLEDATLDFLKLAQSGQGPTPLAVTLMDDPAQIDKEAWRTVLCLPANGRGLEEGSLGGETKLRNYFNTWHFFPNNPQVNYVTSGPTIDYWGFCGPRDYEGNSPGDFVWQNYLWKLKGHVTSAVGLKEVRVYDGTALFRRYLPGGKATFEFTMDLSHDRQHTLALVVTDLKGGKAVSGDHWDRNHRLEEFMCSDRNNQLTYSLTPRKDGTGLMMGGNQMLATPCKRIANGISPSGTFKNDGLLGAPAFDGAAWGEPQVWEDIKPIAPARPVPTPNVTEAVRLLDTRDLNIGSGIRENTFADGIDVLNVWYTLWKTVPATVYHVTRRNTYFQIDPDSPLPVFLWQMDLILQEDLPNKGFEVLSMRPDEAKLWLLHSSDHATYAGNWEDAQRTQGRTLTVPFSRDAYAYFTDSPLGGAAIYPLTDGLQASLSLPQRNSLSVILPEKDAPKKKGETRHIEVLLVGVPRVTDYTLGMPAATTEVAERFYHDFGLDGGETGYTLQVKAGKVVDRRYILNIEAIKAQAFSGTISGKLISSLPIAVSGLHDRWSSYLYDRGLHKARPIGVLNGKAWATVCINGKSDLFVGHPVTSDDPAVTIQVTQTGENTWALEAHNPTDRAITTTLRLNPFFDPLQGKTPTIHLTIPPGSSVAREL